MDDGDSGRLLGAHAEMELASARAFQTRICTPGWVPQLEEGASQVHRHFHCKNKCTLLRSTEGSGRILPPVSHVVSEGPGFRGRSCADSWKGGRRGRVGLLS